MRRRTRWTSSAVADRQLLAVPEPIPSKSEKTIAPEPAQAISCKSPAAQMLGGALPWTLVTHHQRCRACFCMPFLHSRHHDAAAIDEHV